MLYTGYEKTSFATFGKVGNNDLPSAIDPVGVMLRSVEDTLSKV